MGDTLLEAYVTFAFPTVTGAVSFVPHIVSVASKLPVTEINSYVFAKELT